jgi:hypothetical protein
LNAEQFKPSASSQGHICIKFKCVDMIWRNYPFKEEREGAYTCL